MQELYPRRRLGFRVLSFMVYRLWFMVYRLSFIVYRLSFTEFQKIRRDSEL